MQGNKLDERLSQFVTAFKNIGDCETGGQRQYAYIIASDHLFRNRLLIIIFREVIYENSTEIS